jgi:membrane protein YdbS with pleckstrin-like domain
MSNNNPNDKAKTPRLKLPRPEQITPESEGQNIQTPRNHWGRRPEQQPAHLRRNYYGAPHGTRQNLRIESATYTDAEIAPELVPSNASENTKKERNRRVKADAARGSRSDSKSFDQEEVKTYLGGLLEGEEVKRVYYRHWTRFIVLGWLPLVLLVPLTLLMVLLSLRVGGIVFILNIILFFFDFLGLLWFWLDYRNDRLVITSIRIIEKEKIILFKNDNTEIRLEKAQEVRLDSNRGLFEWIFKLGKITITSIGQNKIEFNFIQYPERVRREIDEIVMQWRFENNDARKKRTLTRIEKKLQEHYEGKPAGGPKPSDDPPLSIWKILLPLGKIETHDDKGRVIMTWHTHPFILFKNTIWKILSFFFMALLLIFPVNWFIFSQKSTLLTIGTVLVFVVLFVIQITRFLLSYENWRNDRYIIRPDEFVMMKKLPFGFEESVGVIKMFNVQDVAAEKLGFWANIFNFGTVTISAAGKGEPLKFTNISRPNDIEEEVNKRIERAKDIREDIEDNRNMEMIYYFFQENDKYIRKRSTDNKPPRGDQR